MLVYFRLSHNSGNICCRSADTFVGRSYVGFLEYRAVPWKHKSPKAKVDFAIRSKIHPKFQRPDTTADHAEPTPLLEPCGSDQARGSHPCTASPARLSYLAGWLSERPDGSTTPYLHEVSFANGDKSRYPIRRLIVTGEDTPENLAVLLGPLWEPHEGGTIKKARIEVLICPPPGSPLSASYREHDRGSPA